MGRCQPAHIASIIRQSAYSRKLRRNAILQKGRRPILSGSSIHANANIARSTSRDWRTVLAAWSRYSSYLDCSTRKTMTEQIWARWRKGLPTRALVRVMVELHQELQVNHQSLAASLDHSNHSITHLRWGKCLPPLPHQEGYQRKKKRRLRSYQT